MVDESPPTAAAACRAEYLIRRHRDMVGASRNCNFKSPRAMTTLNYSPADGLQASPEGTAGWRDHGPSQAGLAARRASSADIPFVLLIQSGRQTPLRPLQGLRTAATRPRSLDARPPEEIRLRPYRIFVVAAVFAEPARRRAAPDIVHGERNFRVAARIKRSLMSFLTAISPSYSPRDCSQPRPLSGNVF